MITADQIIAHCVGDYLLQSDWMANKKRSETWAAMAHAFAYSLPFLLLVSGTPLFQLLVIVGTHFLIDRFGLARYLVFAKNFIAPSDSWPTWANCVGTGYPAERPPWLAVWLLIIADNVLHILINGAALRYL